MTTPPPVLFVFDDDQVKMHHLTHELANDPNMDDVIVWAENAVLAQIDEELEEFKVKAKVALFDYANLEQILYFREIFEDYKVISETKILDAKEVKLPNGETDCYNVFVSQKELADTGEVETETFYVCNKDKVIKFSTDEI